MAVAFIVIAIAIGFGVEIWAAMHADGLVIDAFNVPPAMADKGLTGQVVASKLLDRLTILQNETVSSRAASSFASDWTNDIKVRDSRHGRVPRPGRALPAHESRP